MSQPQLKSARDVAYSLLLSVAQDAAYANILLPKLLNKANLEQRDSAFAQELSFGTMRWQGFYDRVIAIAANRDAAGIDLPALTLLRLGAHQLLGMRVPSHAALSETVDQAKRVLHQSAVGFINGVLRRVSEKTREEWLDELLVGVTDKITALSIEHSHPEWIIRAFDHALRVDGRADQLESLLEADNEPTSVNIVALPGFAEPEDTADLTPGGASPIGFALPSGDPARLPGIQAGRLRVQDQGSQLAAILFVNAAPVAEGERWLDLCAGPGGKAALLAAVAAQTGADLTANEVLEHRATLVRQAIKPVNPSVRVTNNDGREFGKNHPATYDRILVDAPCTGLGSLRRRPESRWTKSAGDLAELNKLQWQLLESAWQALKPGGVIGYVTCSPHQAETNGIVVQAQKTWGDDLEVLDANELLAELNPSLELNRSRRTVQLWPQVHGTDAMFIALLRKRAVGELESKRG